MFMTEAIASPLVSSIIGFALGVIIGWFLRGAANRKKLNVAGIVQTFVFFLIVVTWGVATINAATSGGSTPYPPLFLNVMFGTVVGSTFTNFKETMIELLNAFKK